MCGQQAQPVRCGGPSAQWAAQAKSLVAPVTGYLIDDRRGQDPGVRDDGDLHVFEALRVPSQVSPRVLPVMYAS